MTELVRFEADDGSFMWVETTPRNHGEGRLDLVAEPDGVKKVTTRLEDSLASVRGAAVAFMATVDKLSQRADPLKLDEVSMELGLSMGVEGGVIVAKGTAKAEASVTLTWRAAPARN